MAAIAHRGPDGEGVHIEDGAALGHRRLAIVDIEGGKQPFYNVDGQYVLIFNGMIYNFRSIAEDLKSRGCVFKTKSDTEVLLHAYIQWGEDCLDRFSGMFAFAIYDRSRRKLFCARDRFGEKPFYYATSPDGFFLFGSELGAIEAGLDATPEICGDAVADYFAFGYVPDPKTIFRDVFKLPPAHCLALEAGGSEPAPKPRRYWRLDFAPSDEMAAKSDEAISAELVERFRASTMAMQVADVPLGAFLSGGVDSSGVVAMMATGGVRDIETCSIGFDDPAYDESGYAREVAKLFGTRHNEKIVSVDAVGLIDRIARAYGEPFADPSAFPTYLVSEVARERVTVSLSGDGGDEIFAGYRRYAFHIAEERVKSRLPGALRAPVFGALAGVYPKLDWAPRFLRARATFEALSKDAVGGYFRALAVTPAAEWRRLRGEALDSAYDPSAQMRAAAETAGGADPLGRIQTIDLSFSLPGGMLTKVDRASMAHGLEVRAPFLDHEFAQWAARLPASKKIEGFEGKAALKRALEPYLPRDILYRPKQGFNMPIAAWLQGPLAPMVDDLLDERRIREQGFFDPRAIRRAWQEHRSGWRSHRNLLWSLVVFQLWLEDPGRSDPAG
ncbi:MAG: amidotransferase 1, exosortase A system-associated [Parvularculaceae bacterium]